MAGWSDHLPAIAMVTLQFVSAVKALLNRASLLTGMSPMIFTVYRQAIAALVTFPVYYFTRGRSSRSKARMELKSFVLIFIAAFVGVVMSQVFYSKGLYMTSSSIGTASANLTPAITFILVVLLRMEKVNLTKLSTIAKIMGTVVSVGGAICIALLRGPKILNNVVPTSFSNILVLESSSTTASDNNWILGCLLLFASKSCWAVWLIMQVPISRCFPDPLLLSAWMSLIAMLQAVVIALFTDPDPEAWNLSTPLELSSCFFSGIIGSGVTFFIQSWCITRRGPFYSSIFGPLSTVITTVLACIFLQEELFVGSLLGAIGVIVGLYIVLWGKSEEKKEIAHSIIEESQSHGNDLEQPLLRDDPRKIVRVA